LRVFPEKTPEITKSSYVVEVDGSSRYNPGPAGIGIRILAPDKTVVKEISRFIGLKTNNQAEYEAIAFALKEVKSLAPHPVVIQTDSELVYYQLMGKYRVRDEKLKKLHSYISDALKKIPHVQIKLVSRNENESTDKLAKAASERGVFIEKKG